MTGEYVVAFFGSIVGVAIGVVACYRLERWDSSRRAGIKAAERVAAMGRHPAGKGVVESEVEQSRYVRRVKP